MVKPGIALLIGIFVLFVIVLIFWPKKGLVSLWTRNRLNTKRTLMEDTLKFIFDCEYKNQSCGFNSIAGNLNVSTSKATKIIDQLQSMGLIRFPKNEIRLTDAGRSYALQIIRVHRVWERYLADETDVSHMEWHEAADLKEHHMSLEEADKLAVKMGNPVYDPHGDPIPSSKGELPSHRGQPLSSLKEGDIARITHIEDEPPTIYTQLVALDLYPGMQVYVMDVSDEKIQFAANGEECVLSPLFASNITVELLPEDEPLEEKYKLLSSLEVGEKGEIIGISKKCRGQSRRRLMDLGIVPGSVVSAELESAFGDPVAYRILGANIAIRENQADKIFINPIEERQ